MRGLALDWQMTELRLLGGGGPGDLPAFETLMRRHERLVLVTALRLPGNLPDAQDVSQEVLLKLYRIWKVTSEEALRGGCTGSR